MKMCFLAAGFCSKNVSNQASEHPKEQKRRKMGETAFGGTAMANERRENGTGHVEAWQKAERRNGESDLGWKSHRGEQRDESCGRESVFPARLGEEGISEAEFAHFGMPMEGYGALLFARSERDAERQRGLVLSGAEDGCGRD